MFFLELVSWDVCSFEGKGGPMLCGNLDCQHTASTRAREKQKIIWAEPLSLKQKFRDLLFFFFPAWEFRFVKFRRDKSYKINMGEKFRKPIIIVKYFLKLPPARGGQVRK
jgi:hypothetical protein